MTFEGTNKIKGAKMRILLEKYETFEMKSNETVTQMDTRYIDIVNGLAYQEKTFTNGENVNKILRALPKEWNRTKTSIQETLRIMPQSMDKLIGILMAYEAKKTRWM